MALFPSFIISLEWQQFVQCLTFSYKGLLEILFREVAFFQSCLHSTLGVSQEVLL